MSKLPPSRYCCEEKVKAGVRVSDVNNTNDGVYVYVNVLWSKLRVLTPNEYLFPGVTMLTAGIMVMEKSTCDFFYDGIMET